MNAVVKTRLFPEPDPLAVVLYRIMRLTMLPPAPSETILQPNISRQPTSKTWDAIVETAVPTIYPEKDR